MKRFCTRILSLTLAIIILLSSLTPTLSYGVDVIKEEIPLADEEQNLAENENNTDEQKKEAEKSTEKETEVEFVEEPEEELWSNTEELSDNNEAVVEEKYEVPSTKILKTAVGETTVKIEYNEGVFPEGASLKAQKIENQERAQKIEQAIEEKSSQKVEQMEAIDLTVEKNGKELQPDTSRGKVTVTIEDKNISKDINIFHFEDDENTKLEKEKSKATNESVQFEAEHFSIVAWAKLSGYTETNQEIYITWDEDTKTIALSWNQPTDGTESASISDFRDFTYNYRDSVTKIDFTLKDTSGNQVLIKMPEDCSGVFANYTKLVELDVSVCDMSNVTNSRYMFAGCTSLEKLNLSGWNTSKVTNMSNMFSGCTNLKELDLSSLDTSNVTDMSNMFYNTGFEELDLSNFNTSKVTNMSAMFNSCKNLKKVNLSGWDMSKVTNNSGMLYGNTKLEEVNFSNATMPASLADMFAVCSSLKTVNFNGANTSSVTNTRSMFAGCTSLEELDLSGWDTSKLTNVSMMFGGCGHSKLNLSGWDLSKTNGGMFQGNGSAYVEEIDFSNAIMPASLASFFAGCTSLKSVNFSNVDTSRVTNMQSLFAGCGSIQELDLSSFDTSKVTNMQYLFDHCNSLTKLSLSGWDMSKVTNNSSMLSGKAKLEEVNLSNAIMPSSLASMFAGCSSLKNINFNNTDTSNVTNMTNMFASCNSLEEINLSDLNTSNVTNMRDMFAQCGNLTKINLSGLDMSKVTDYSSIFYNDSKLEEVNLSNAIMSVSLNCFFAGCSSLKSVNFNNVDTSRATNMQYLFAGCGSLQELDLSSFDTSKVKNMGAMFAQCENLQQIDLSSFDTSNVTNISSLFSMCSSLQELNLSSWNTSNVTNANTVFSGCTELNKITLSQDITQEPLQTLSYGWKKESDGTFYLSLYDSYDSSTIAGTYIKANYLIWNDETKTISVGKGEKADDYATLEDFKSFVQKYKSEVEIIDLESDEKIVLAEDGCASLFKDCTKLTEIKNIETLDISNVTDMSSMFENCTSLTSLDLSKIEEDYVVEVETMNSMFKNCSSLTDFTFFGTRQKLEDGTLTGMTAIDLASMFEGCSSLETLNLEYLIPWEAKTLNSMFKDCSNLVNVDLKRFTPINCTDMSHMFENCTSLILDWVDFIGEDVQDVSYMFKNCDGLRVMFFMIDEEAKPKNISHLFEDCDNLSYLKLYSLNTENLQENGMENVFSGLNLLQKMELGPKIQRLDANCGLTGETWLKQTDEELYTAEELIAVYEPSMADIYLNGVIEQHYYVSLPQGINNMYEVHNADKLFTGYCMNLKRIGYGTVLDRLDANDEATIESLLCTAEEGSVHGYAPLGSNMKEALITLLYYGYPRDAVGIMERYNLTDLQYANITQNAIWDFTDRYGNPSGPSLYTGDELAAYNELVSKKYNDIPDANNQLFYVYKSWNQTQQNMISLTSVADGIYGGVEIRKLDADGNPLAGAEFTITNVDTNYTRTITSSATGVASICRTDQYEGLPQGTYKVTETKAPKGYDLSTDYYEFSITEANVIVTMGYFNGTDQDMFMTFIDAEDETIVGGGLQISKKSINNESLAGAEFKVYSDANCTNEVATYITDAEGNAKSGTKDFEPGTYYVKETKAPYGYKGDTAVHTVTIVADTLATLEISNEAKKGTAKIEASKVLNNADIKDYTFKFQLMDDQGNVIQTKTNDVNGKVVFDEIEYTTSMGTYKNYTIKEVKETLNGIIYDEHEELVTVTIADNGENILLCTPVYDGDGAVFTNTAEQTSVEVTKEWKNSNDLNATPPLSVVVNLFKNGVKIVSKQITSTDNWTYVFENLLKYTVTGDKINYTVTEDEVNGYKTEITGTAEDGYKVTNTAKLGYATIEATKKLTGADIKNYVFKFQLIDSQGRVLQTKTNNESGKVIFDEIEYTVEMGEEVNYTIKEVIENISGITYDEHEEQVKVKIQDDGTDTLKCDVVYEEEGNVFENNIETINITIKNKWKDDDGEDENSSNNDENKGNDNEDNKDHPTIIVNIVVDEEIIETKEITDDEYTFKNLPKYTPNGKEIEYKVTVETLDEYDTKIEGNVKDGFTILNIHKKEQKHPEKSTTKTGDSIIMSLAIFIIATITLGVTTGIKKKV